MRSLYVHFPFCESKCHYCDFYSIGRERTGSGDSGKFATALRAEAHHWREKVAGHLFDTLFFGGGTPSMTPAAIMREALEPLLGKNPSADGALAPGYEWTMEANPSSVNPGSLREYRALGVNRISMGVQAMRDDLLARLGRVHSREAALRALEAIFDAGFGNVSVDLLCGAPSQTESDLEEALTTLTRYPITHLSCYLLTLPPQHRMHKELPDEDTQLSHLLLIDRWMRARGFEHYEISNYALPGREARHNLNYWKGRGYLGLGPSAHSYDPASQRRWKNVSSLHRYAELLARGDSPIEWTETLTEEQRDLERWMLGLRLSEGFPAGWLESPAQRSKANKLLEGGILEPHPADSGRLRLTPRGFALSDQVVATLS